MSRPKRLSRTRPIFLRLPGELAEAIESIAKEVGLGRTDVIKILLTNALEEVSTNEELSAYCRLKALDALIEELKREEEKLRRTWKQMLRSHPKAYLLRNIDLDYFKDRRKIERLNELIKDPKLKEAIEVVINRLDHITKQIAELLIAQKELLQKLHKDYKPIKKYLEETEEMITTPGPQYD